MREGLPLQAEPIEEPDAPSPYISDEHRRMHAADERRRRGLPIEEKGAPSAVAEFIARADEKRRGVNQPDIVTGPPQTAPLKASAESILAAYRKSREGLDKK